MSGNGKEKVQAEKHTLAVGAFCGDDCHSHDDFPALYYSAGYSGTEGGCGETDGSYLYTGQ